MVYRPFALLAFGAAILGGVPLGVRMLAWLHLGAAAVSIEWLLLHASLQTFGFLATLIVGVAPHLVERFTGRPLAPSPRHHALAALLGAGLVLRIAGTSAESGAAVLAGAACQAMAFIAFGRWVWSSLDPPPLAIVRRQLAASTAWLALALLLEVAARAVAWLAGRAVPDAGILRAVHALALEAGVLGWVLGVLLRAGPMFVAGWQVPTLVARLLPLVLGAGALVSAGGEIAATPGVARLGDLVAVGGGAAMLLSAGAFRHVPKALPMLSRSAEESRIARVALVSLPLAAVGAAALTVAVAFGVATHVATDAVRHLLTVGFLTSIVVAMSFRLVPALERVALPWPGLRRVAFAAIVGAVVLRTAQVFVPAGLLWLSPAVALSGALVWVALVAAAANLVGAIARSVS